jgi:beta-lactamase superfamily II metal-dependent hydrolase
MAEQLLVRMFDVGLGDCIYVRVPDKGRAVHILIDCGNKFSGMNLLQEAIANLESELPKNRDGTRNLDLLVVTHPHEDHHKGFEPDFFGKIKIKNLWLSPAFCELDEKCRKKEGGSNGLRALQASAQTALRNLVDVSPAGETRDYLEDMLLSLSKAEAFDELNRNLPKQNGIKPKYVTADFKYDPGFKPQDVSQLFQDPGTRLTILGPMSDIDKYYLSGSGQPLHLALGETPGMGALPVDPSLQPLIPPGNISSQDFDLLRRGIQGNALAIAAIVGHAVNNLSVVLLLEWKGNRLLFPGDAEWEGSQIELKPGGGNGSWNVMWPTQQPHLSKALDFLKVGHHGSENATPWAKDHPISQILDKLLPAPKGGKKPTARAVLSTQRTSRWQTIPDPALLQELGVRARNIKKDYVGDKKMAPGISQPERTDQERLKRQKKWIDETFPPK